MATSNLVEWLDRALGGAGALSLAQLPPPHTGQDQAHVSDEGVLPLIC